MRTEGLKRASEPGRWNELLNRKDAFSFEAALGLLCA